MAGKQQLSMFAPTSIKELTARTPLKDTIPVFQQHLQRDGKTDHTLNAFTSDLNLFASYNENDDRPIGSFTTTQLNEFLHWLEFERGKPCSRKSYARRVTTLKVFFKWLYTRQIISIDPADAVLQRSGPAPLSAILNEDEIQTAITFTAGLRRGEKPDARPEMLFRLLVETGMKKGEVMNLTPEEITRGVSPSVRVRHKTVRTVYQERNIPVSRAWISVLDEYLAQYTPQNTLFTCSARNLEYILDDIGTGAGLSQKISFDMLRWTCAVRDFKSGDDPDAIREKLGLSRVSWVETLNKIRQLAARDSKDAQQ